MEDSGFHGRRRMSWPLIAGIAAAHVLVVIGLTYAFAPDFSRMVVDEATSLVTVTVSTYEEPEPEPSPANRPDEGAAAEEGREETPRAVTAPPVTMMPHSAKRAASVTRR